MRYHPTYEVLELLQIGRFADARRVFDAIQPDAISTKMMKRWTQTRELLGIANELPDNVREMLAFGIRRDRLTHARGALHRFATRDPEGAAAVAQLLDQRAPDIAGLVGRALDPAQPPTTVNESFLFADDTRRLRAHYGSTPASRMKPLVFAVVATVALFVIGAIARGC